MQFRLNRVPNLFPIILGLFILLIGIWQFTPLHHHLDLERLIRLGSAIRGHSWTPMVVPLIFIIAALIGFSHALLIWATAFTFPVLQAIAYAEAGTLAGAICVYGVGRLMRQDLSRRLAGSSWEKISHAVGQNGVSAMVILHVFPVTPNSVLNLVCGASHIRFRDFILGTILGASPGILTVCVFGDRLIKTIEHPRALDFVLLGLFVLLAWYVLSHFRNRLLKQAGIR